MPRFQGWRGLRGGQRTPRRRRGSRRPAAQDAVRVVKTAARLGGPAVRSSRRVRFNLPDEKFEEVVPGQQLQPQGEELWAPQELLQLETTTFDPCQWRKEQLRRLYAGEPILLQAAVDTPPQGKQHPCRAHRRQHDMPPPGPGPALPPFVTATALPAVTLLSYECNNHQRDLLDQLQHQRRRLHWGGGATPMGQRRAAWGGERGCGGGGGGSGGGDMPMVFAACAGVHAGCHRRSAGAKGGHPGGAWRGSGDAGAGRVVDAASAPLRRRRRAEYYRGYQAVSMVSSYSSFMRCGGSGRYGGLAGVL